MKRISHFQVEDALFPHLSPMGQSPSAISFPTLSALIIKSSCKHRKTLSTIVAMVPASTVLRTFSTHFIVRSIIALSTLDRALNQTLVLKALDLIFKRSCLVINSIDLPSSHRLRSVVEDDVLYEQHEKSSIKELLLNIM